MELFLSWLHLLSESALLKHPALQSVNSLLFAYVLLALVTKRLVILLAFFMSCLLFLCVTFDILKEWHLYCLVAVMYSYIIRDNLSNKSMTCCAIIFSLSLAMMIDAFMYEEFNGASQTVLYNNVEFIATSAHIIFIYSFVDHTKIRNSLRGLARTFVILSRHSYRFNIIWYNRKKTSQIYQQWTT